MSFALWTVALILTLFLAQCGATPAPQVEIQTVVVEKEVEGETVKVVETVVVTQEVEKEVVVTATPEAVEEPVILRIEETGSEMSYIDPKN